MWVWLTIGFGTVGLISIAAIIADVVTKDKEIELKRLEREIELEQLRLQTFDKETERMRLELEQSKQALLELKKE